MNILSTAIAGILLTSGLQQTVFGMEAEENPYRAIVKRNAFDLTSTVLTLLVIPTIYYKFGLAGERIFQAKEE